MKTIFTLRLLMASAVFSGCTTSKPGLVLDAVGPPMSKSVATTATNGTLLVYSAYEVNPNFTSRDPYGQKHSNYKIFNPQGDLIQIVHNDTGTMLQDAVPIELPPGNYRVRAHANGYLGEVTVPVVVAAHQDTILHLEGGGGWPDESSFNQTNAVRLPNGTVIGWKAAAD